MRSIFFIIYVFLLISLSKLKLFYNLETKIRCKGTKNSQYMQEKFSIFYKKILKVADFFTQILLIFYSILPFNPPQARR